MTNEKRIRDNRISWVAYGDNITIEFWCAVWKDKTTIASTSVHRVGDLWLAAGGIEKHSSVPLWDGQAETHTRCTFLGRPCFHSGTALAASEFFWTWDGDDEAAFALVNRWLLNNENSIVERLHTELPSFTEAKEKT